MVVVVVVVVVTVVVTVVVEVSNYLFYLVQDGSLYVLACSKLLVLARSELMPVPAPARSELMPAPACREGR